MLFWRLRSLLIVAVAALSLASCNSGDSPLGVLGGGGHGTNSKDAAFLRAMTDHEQATLGITRLAERRALRAELRGIARTMTSEERQDLRALGSLARPLGKRTAPPPNTSRAPIAAMVDLARVKDATSFDYEFMRTMIDQNQAAIAIARDEERLGGNPAVKRLATEIRLARERELARIRAWLRLWYGGDIQPSPPSPGPPRGGGGQTPRPGPSPPQRRPGVPL